MPKRLKALIAIGAIVIVGSGVGLYFLRSGMVTEAATACSGSATISGNVFLPSGASVGSGQTVRISSTDCNFSGSATTDTKGHYRRTVPAKSTAARYSTSASKVIGPKCTVSGSNSISVTNGQSVTSTINMKSTSCPSPTPTSTVPTW